MSTITTARVPWHLSESGILIVDGIWARVVYSLLMASLVCYRVWNVHSWCLPGVQFEAERNGDPTDDCKGFIGKLAYQLIHNHYLDQPMELRSTSNEHDDVSEEVDVRHRLDFVKNRPSYSGATDRKQRKCRICSAKTSYYCVGCSNIGENELYGCCEPGTQDCFKSHLGRVGL